MRRGFVEERALLSRPLKAPTGLRRARRKPRVRQTPSAPSWSENALGRGLLRDGFVAVKSMFRRADAREDREGRGGASLVEREADMRNAHVIGGDWREFGEFYLFLTQFPAVSRL